ncbi:uncharacterized protein G2W53_003288 [Senna tora]|uniref:Uncharacterized protein n=1 Tax=Senna tora TaxID=362788 RepID=A0A835CI99_9FABA|nr:uncharacterized protein G2W53_003288 [Senna tora]
MRVVFSEPGGHVNNGEMRAKNNGEYLEVVIYE